MTINRTYGGHILRIAFGILSLIIVMAAYTGVVGAQPTPGWYHNGAGTTLYDNAGLKITWQNSYIYPHPGEDNLYWYTEVVYLNNGSQTLPITCSERTDPSLAKENMRGTANAGIVAAEETFCNRNPSFTRSLNPGETHKSWAIFHNVPNGGEVSLEWSQYGSSTWVDPWYSPFSAPPPAECPPELVTRGTCQPTTPTPTPTSSPTPSPTPTQTQPKPTVTAPTPAPTPPTPTKLPPEIVRVETFREGDLVFFRLFFTDPNNDAEGFGFRGTNGSGWAEETHPFSSPSYGRVSPGRIEYPFNLNCETGPAYESDVEAWIYDSAGLRSPSITVHLSCQSKILGEHKESISGGGGIVGLEGVGEVELPEDANRSNADIIVRQLEAPLEQKLFVNSTPDDPLLKYTDTVLEVESNIQINQSAAIRINVPNDFATSVPENHELDIFAKVIGDDGETFISLDGTYNPETGVISSTLPPYVWYEAERVQPTAGNNVSLASVDSQTRVARVIVATGTSRQILNLNNLILLQATGRFSSISGGGSKLSIQGNERMNIRVLAQGARVSTIRQPFNDPIPPITQNFGGTHNGIDYGADASRDIIATHDGRIKFDYMTDTDCTNDKGYKKPETDKFLTGYGYYALLTHYEQGVPLYTTRYAHLTLDTASVPINSEITRNTIIAKAGNTGCSTGNHLHFEYMIGTNRIVNPADYFEGSPTTAQHKIGLRFNGNLVPESIQQLQEGQTEYNLPIDFTTQRLTAGKSYTLDLVLISPDGHTSVLDWAIVSVGVNPLRVTLTWDKINTDVDLHIRDVQGNEAWYRNLCGLPNACLDRDDVDGYGPEVFTLLSAQKGMAYTVFLHYYSDHGNGATTATVNVELNGRKTTIVKDNITNNQVVDIGTYTPNP